MQSKSQWALRRWTISHSMAEKEERDILVLPGTYSKNSPKRKDIKFRL